MVFFRAWCDFSLTGKEDGNKTQTIKNQKKPKKGPKQIGCNFRCLAQKKIRCFSQRNTQQFIKCPVIHLPCIFGMLTRGLGSKIIRLDESEATGCQGVPDGFLHGLKPMGRWLANIWVIMESHGNPDVWPEKFGEVTGFGWKYLKRVKCCGVLIHSRMELWLFESVCCTFTRMYAPRWDMVRCTLEKWLGKMKHVIAAAIGTYLSTSQP